METPNTLQETLGIFPCYLINPEKPYYKIHPWNYPPVKGSPGGCQDRGPAGTGGETRGEFPVFPVRALPPPVPAGPSNTSEHQWDPTRHQEPLVQVKPVPFGDS